jgi:hypothetical protein
MNKIRRAIILNNNDAAILENNPFHKKFLSKAWINST